MNHSIRVTGEELVINTKLMKLLLMCFLVFADEFFKDLAIMHGEHTKLKKGELTSNGVPYLFILLAEVGGSLGF